MDVFECARVSQPNPWGVQILSKLRVRARLQDMRIWISMSKLGQAWQSIKRFKCHDDHLGLQKVCFIHFSLTIIPRGKWAWPMPLVLSKQISSHWFEVIPISSMLISLIPNKETSQISKLWIKSNCLSYRHTGTGQIMGWRFIFGFDLY